MFGFRIIFHAADHTRLLVAFAGLPLQADDVLLAIIVMQNGRIETGGSQIHRLAPRAFNILRLNKIIIHVEIACIHGIHNTINHVEHVLFLTIREARSPNALSARQLGKVRIRIIGKHMGEQFPMLHVLRMVDRNAWEPFECGNGNIIVVTFTANGRIRIEAFKNRILQHYLSFDFCFSFFVFYLLRFCFSYCGARRLLQCYLVTAVSAGVCDALLLTRSKAALASLYGLNRASQTPARNAFALRCVALTLCYAS